MATRKNRTNGTAVLCIAILTALAPACTEPYTAPPLGPSPPYVDPGTPLPAPAPTPGTLPLTVTLTIGPNSPTVGNDAAFMAAASAPMTAPIAYAWTFGDGGSRSTSTETTLYTFSRSGSYRASVKVTDAKGLAATGAATVAVQPRTPTTTPPPPPPPVLTASLFCTPQGLATPTSCNLILSFNGATVPSSMITQVDWNWGDGSPIEGGANPSNQHTYTQIGNHAAVATVTATTTAGPKTASGSATVATPSLNASLSCTPQVLTLPTPCNVTASYGGATVPSAATTVDWDWGDGVPDPGPAFNDHSYAQIGTYTVVATVTATATTGPQTATAIATVAVTTPPPPPGNLVASLTCIPKPALTPTPCMATVTYNGVAQLSGTVTNVDWDFGDGNHTTTSVPVSSNPYAIAGSVNPVTADVTADTPAGSVTARATTTVTIP